MDLKTVILNTYWNDHSNTDVVDGNDDGDDDGNDNGDDGSNYTDDGNDDIDDDGNDDGDDDGNDDGDDDGNDNGDDGNDDSDDSQDGNDDGISLLPWWLIHCCCGEYFTVAMVTNSLLRWWVNCSLLPFCQFHCYHSVYYYNLSFEVKSVPWLWQYVVVRETVSRPVAMVFTLVIKGISVRDMVIISQMKNPISNSCLITCQRLFWLVGVKKRVFWYGNQ